MKNIEKSPAQNYQDAENHALMRPYIAMPSGPAVDQYTALSKQIAAGHYTDPNEIWDVVQMLMEEGYRGYADRLAKHLPD